MHRFGFELRLADNGQIHLTEIHRDGASAIAARSVELHLQLKAEVWTESS